MPILRKSDTSIEILHEALTVENRDSWIEALANNSRQKKLIFNGCDLTALPLSRLLYELKNKYNCIEVTNCRILGNEESLQLLIPRLSNVLKQSNPLSIVVEDDVERCNVTDIDWSSFIDNLLHSNSSFKLNTSDETGEPIHLEINQDRQVSNLEDLLTSSNDLNITIPLPAGSSLQISLNEGKLSIKQLEPRQDSSFSSQELTEAQAVHSQLDTIVNSHMIFYYLGRAISVAKTRDFSLDIDVQFNSSDTFAYSYNPRTGEAKCDINLFYSEENSNNAMKGQEDIIADRLPLLFSKLPGVTQLQLFSLNSRLLKKEKFSQVLHSGVFANLEKLEICGNFDTPESKKSLLNALKQFNHLYELKLLGQSLRKEDMLDLAYVLMTKEKLKEVTFNGAGINDEAMRCLATELKKLGKNGFKKQLEKFDLSANTDTDDSDYSRASYKYFLEILRELRPQDVLHDFGKGKAIDSDIKRSVDGNSKIYGYPIRSSYFSNTSKSEKSSWKVGSITDCGSAHSPRVFKSH